MGLAALLAAAPARGGDAPEGLAREVDRLLGQLASDDYAVRETARTRLAAVARDARSLLVARRDDPDPEVRRTVASLLASLGEPEPPPVPTGVLGNLGRVTFRAEGTLAEVLARWTAEIGGRVTVPADAAATPVKVAVEDVPYFRALDAVLAAARLDVPDGFDEAGNAVATPRAAGSAAPASAASGPFRLDVTSVAVERTFRPRERREPTVRLRLSWSPAVHVTSLSSPKVVRAVDAAGTVLNGVPMQTMYGVGRQRSAQPEVRLAAVEGPLADRLEALDLRVELRVRSGAEGVTFEDLRTTALPAVRTGAGTASAPATKVTLTSFGPDPDHAGYVVADLTAALARGVPPDSVVVMLETPGEGVRPLYDLSNRIAASDGTVRIRVRTPGALAEPGGRILRVVWYTKEEELAVPFSLLDVPLR